MDINVCVCACLLDRIVLNSSANDRLRKGDNDEVRERERMREGLCVAVLMSKFVIQT